MRVKNLLVSLFTILLILTFTPNISFAKEASTEKAPNDKELVKTNEEVHIPEQEEIVPDGDSNQDALEGEPETQKNSSSNDPDSPSDSTKPEDELVEQDPFDETDSEQAETEVDESDESKDLEESGEHNSEDEVLNEEEQTETEEDPNEEQSEEADKEEVENETDLSEEAELEVASISMLSMNVQSTLSDDKIVQLKKNLSQLGFGRFPSNPSKVYGSVTEGVVEEFQEYFGLPITGKADNRTLNKLEVILNPPYKDGDRGKHISELKKDLTKLGFGNFPSNPSIFYGSVTTRVVSDFQSHFGVGGNGVANQTTLNTIRDILNSEYTNGQNGEHVKDLKLNLTALGFGNFPTSPSNAYGNVTNRVVREFQEYYDLPLSGIADYVTLQKIKDVLSAPYQDGDRGKHISELKKDLTKLGFGNFPSNPSIFYGNVTSRVVLEFQTVLGFSKSGIADQVTLAKIDELVNSPYADGQSGSHVRDLKLNLTALGFGNFPTSPSNVYGNVTSRVVREFQEYYDLPLLGIADNTTLQKLEEVLNPPHKNGDRGQAIVDLKKNLSKIGFGSFPTNPSIYYGSVTERVVKEFQSFFELSQNGIAGNEVLEKIEQIINNPYKDGSKGGHVTQLKNHLTSLGFGNFPSNPSVNYGTVTTNVVKTFQEYYGLSNKSGTANNETIQKINEILNSPYRDGQKGPHVKQLKLDLTQLGFGNFPSNPSQNYGSVTKRVVMDFQTAFNLVTNGIFDSVSIQTLENSLKENKQTLIVLDAGHGGYDPGAVANGLLEKEVNLDIAKRTRNILEDAGYKVIMTRTSDTALSLDQRSSLANNQNADLFISIHANACGSCGATGIETWWYGKYEATNSRNLATQIQNELIKQTSATNRGVKGSTNGTGPGSGNLHVIRETTMPSVLIESGFVDSFSDASKLNTATYQNQVARGIVNGIKNYFRS